MIQRSIQRVLPAAIFAAACLPSTALAWKHVDPPWAWLPEDMPIKYVIQEECEGSVPPDYCVPMIDDSFAAWEALPCMDISSEYDGIYEGSPPGVLHTFDLADLSNHYSFEDPDGTLEPGVLGATRVQSFGLAFQLNGQNYLHATNGDISFNDLVEFATHEDIIGGQCNGRTNMRSVAVHEIGHLLGMGHSCDDGEVCTDPDLKGAVMYWTSAACEDLIEPQVDDIQGITALYGPSAQFSCSHQVQDADLALGVVPFELKCVVESRDFLEDVTGAEWTFGDGGTAEGINASHVYEEPGNYTVRVGVQGQSDGCGEEGWTADFRKVGFVRACGVPQVSFSVEHVEGRQYQMLNNTDVSVYGCIQDIVWSVYKGDKVSGNPIDGMSVKAWEPIFDFEEDGTYTVVGNIGGPAGTGAAKLTFDVKNRRANGCDTVGAAGLGGISLVLGFGLLGLRRRKD